MKLVKTVSSCFVRVRSPQPINQLPSLLFVVGIQQDKVAGCTTECEIHGSFGQIKAPNEEDKSCFIKSTDRIKGYCNPSISVRCNWKY